MDFKEIDEIIEELNSGKYESEMGDIFDQLKKDDNVISAIDKIFENSLEIDEIQTKVLLVLKEHMKVVAKDLSIEVKFDERKIAKDIAKLSRDILDENLERSKKESEDSELSYAKIDKRDKFRHITGPSRENFKKLLKNFAIYEVYKVMNPRQIAGETKKSNYIHNQMIGGKKLANKNQSREIF